MLSRSHYLIYSIVFLFPLFIATTPSVGGVLYVLLFLAGVGLGWSAWGDLEAWEKKILIGFVLFCALISLSLINNHDVVNGVKRLTRYMHFPLLIPMYLLLKKYKVETGKVFLIGLLATSVVMFGQAIYQTAYSSMARATGAVHPIIFGDVAMWSAVVVFCAVITLPKSSKYYFLGFLAISLALIASILSASRGPWILLPVGAVWLLWINRKNVGAIPLISIAVAVVLLIVGALNVPSVSKRVDVAIHEYQAYTNDSTRMSSVGARLEMWRDSIRIWKVNPIIGTGIGDFKSDRLKFFNEGSSYLPHPYRHAHSIYFDVLATAGLVGVVAMMFFMIYLPFQMFNRFYKTETDPWIKFYALSGMATIIAFAVFGLTEGWLARNTLLRVYLMSMLVFMSSIAIRKDRALSSET